MIGYTYCIVCPTVTKEVDVSRPKDDAPNVAVLVETSSGWGRRLIRGVTNYSVKHGNWHLWVEERGRDSNTMSLPAGWDGDAVIARVGTKKQADELHSCNLPIINVSGIELPEADFPKVMVNYESGSALAVDHFVDRGYNHFAYVGPLNYRYVRRHAECFRRAVEETGSTHHQFDHRGGLSSSRNWRQRMDELGDWLESLPKPVGVYCWATWPGLQVIDVCRERHITVPDEVAVLGDDDDPLLCDAASPPMSAVVTASEQLGYLAAQYLDDLLAGKEVPQETLVDPIEITTRRSTEALAITDDELRKAVIFLRQNAYGPLTVDEIADAVPMTRRSLERKFRQFFERTPHEELQRLRLSRVKELLARTDLSIAKVAERAGFANPEHMTTLFRKHFQTTPLRYRTKVRAR